MTAARPLPDGWRRVKLGEVCHLIRGVTFNKSDVSPVAEIGYVPILRAGNIGRELDTANDLIWVPKHYVDNDQMLRVDDIAICMSSGSPRVVGKTALLTSEWYGSVGAFCGIIRARQSSLAKFISFWFGSSHFFKWRNEQARGGSIQNLRVTGLSSLELPVPPVEERRRIVAGLEQEMATAERARRAAKAQLAAAEAVPTALLREIFAGSPSELVARGWRCATLNEICQVFNGSTPKSAVDEYWGGDICWITPADLGNLDSPYIRGSARMITRAGYESCSTTLVPAGSVILSSRAPIGHLGMATMPTCTNQGCKSLVPSDAIDGEFLYSALLHSVGELRALGSGATFSEVSKAKVASFPIHLPPMKEQRRIVEDLERQTAAAALARRAATAQLAAAEALPAAILRRTFGGVT